MGKVFWLWFHVIVFGMNFICHAYLSLDCYLHAQLALLFSPVSAMQLLSFKCWLHFTLHGWIIY